VTTQLDVVFFQERTGSQPVREWLRALSTAEKKKIGKDIKTVQLGWPKGPPLVKSLGGGLWEIRTSLARGESRVLCAIDEGNLILLHGFIKKSAKAPKGDIVLARKRFSMYGET
jgi:phage-related protein